MFSLLHNAIHPIDSNEYEKGAKPYSQHKRDHFGLGALSDAFFFISFVKIVPRSAIATITPIVIDADLITTMFLFTLIDILASSFEIRIALITFITFATISFISSIPISIDALTIFVANRGFFFLGCFSAIIKPNNPI